MPGVPHRVLKAGGHADPAILARKLLLAPAVDIVFENRRLYVAPRKSVLFFARVGGRRVRCYVKEDVLVEPARGLREDADVYQRCLLAFDQHRGPIQAAAKRLLEVGVLARDGAVVVSRSALTLDAGPPLEALNAER